MKRLFSRDGVSGMEAARRIALTRALLGVVAAGLFFSGVTCYFLPWELKTAIDVVWGRGEGAREFLPAMRGFLLSMEEGVLLARRDYPGLFLGTDYLGFAHIILALLFIGPIRDPIKNIWVVQFGIISAALVIPSAFLFGFMRHAPLTHRLLDASFGAGALLLLVPAYLLLGRGPKRSEVRGARR